MNKGELEMSDSRTGLMLPFGLQTDELLVLWPLNMDYTDGTDGEQSPTTSGRPHFPKPYCKHMLSGSGAMQSYSHGASRWVGIM